VDQNVDVTLNPWARFAVAVAISSLFAAFVDRCVDPYFRRKRAALH
jgi:hypothetical protein